MKKFKDFIKIKENATTTADIAVYARPLALKPKCPKCIKKGLAFSEQEYSPIDAAIDIINRKMAEISGEQTIPLAPVVLHPDDMANILDYYGREYTITPIVTKLPSGDVIRSVSIKPNHVKNTVWNKILGR